MRLVERERTKLMLMELKAEVLNPGRPVPARRIRKHGLRHSDAVRDTANKQKRENHGRSSQQSEAGTVGAGRSVEKDAWEEGEAHWQ